ncbi:MAG: U32 family peptidase [Candidatus Omnitrophota bacterium]
MAKKYFNILAPFASVGDVEALKQAGADELYCGYVTPELARRWPLAFLILNRRGEGASFEEYGLFKKAVAKAEKLKLPVDVTMNGFYTPEQYPLLAELAGQIQRVPGVRGLIVSDPGFLLFLKHRGFKKEIHISTLASLFNSRTLSFYKGLGAQRAVLDRQLSAGETKELIRRAGKTLGLELFIVSGPCGVFSDGLCALTHCIEKREGHEADGVSLVSTYGTELDERGCMLCGRLLTENSFDVLDPVTLKKRVSRLRMDAKKYWNFGCRLCELYGLKGLPVKSLKIVGRGVGAAYTARLVTLVARCLGYLSSGKATRRGYEAFCRALFSELALDGKRACTKFDCYYPSFDKG